MNDNRNTLGPRVPASQKEVGDLELVYATITKIDQNNRKETTIHWKHAVNGSKAEHTISSDKLTFRNCYKDIEVGKTYIIVQLLAIYSLRKTRYVWQKAQEVDVMEAKKVFNKCGWRDIDPDVFGAAIEDCRRKRWEKKMKQEQATEKDERNAFIESLVEF